MQKYEFKYKRNEVDIELTKVLYESSYEDAISAFISWIDQNGFVGYVDDKTIIGNPSNRKDKDFAEDFMSYTINVYVIQYTNISYTNIEPGIIEESRVLTYMNDSIQEFIMKYNELKHKENVKNLVVYKGVLSEFNPLEISFK